jgi:hypothetical protein
MVDASASIALRDTEASKPPLSYKETVLEEV